MVKPILCFVHSKNISLMSFMDDNTNEVKCDYKVIFEIHVKALVFMCFGWSINWANTYVDPTWIPLHLGFLWDTMEGTVALSEDKTT